MLKRLSALAGAMLLCGCVTTNTTENTQTPVTTTKINNADFHKQAASAEQIADRLWSAGHTQVQDEVEINAAELEDLWLRIQSQLSFNVPQTRPIVEQRNFYSSHQAYLDRVANRAQPFLYHIVQEIEKRQMPLELALLPIVESAFDPFAYSHAAASGMWQFMPATGKRFGLKQNFWYDGRRDVIASTRAALDYLQYLHDRLEGDWLNAIAAYNSGEGRILAAIKRNKKKRLPTDFWSLDLPAETTAYVPKLLALVDILQRPDDFDIVWKFIANESRISVVDIGSQIDLAIAADLAGLSVAELQALNPGYNQWATDPDGPHQLVVPIAKADIFQQKLAQTSDQNRLRWQRYTVAKGDTLGKIAQKHDTNVNAIKRINKLNNNVIQLGQHLLIPVASADNADYSLSQDARIAKAQQKSLGDAKLDYIVENGDTLWDISRQHNVTVAQLSKWNGIAQRAALKPGQKLVIWQQTSNNERTAGISRTVTYKVRKGDSLARIAQRFSISVSDIEKWNNINSSNYLQPGQQLKLIVNMTQV
ncbi:LysM peptidoglycan-binding domain-containing protein [Rheinheimera maricola]|uniref:LysM peptidoglycan-binding domain-containing protein n=1 Tax=Rheinheimera maricola TaxID=2793282 RepID=A0ABS7XBA7_9GAMM|nr:LysM peptidoglycan-binding domain-containing protein [Rheinheimera maricola]MBZ9612013.1 LysM peptidoglycan-binding domain-containing protein [Rheinheimera maricola]